jgi:hypothetical protein
MASTSKHTQHILFQYSIPRIYWSQQNLDLLSVDSEIQDTYTEVQKGHQRPALPLPRTSCIFTSFFRCVSLLTQISSIYSTILSKLAAPVMCQPASFPNVSPENITMAVVISYWIFLTPIVNYPNRAGNYKMAAKVSHYHHMADTPWTYNIAGNNAHIDEWPPTGIIRDYGHTILEDRSERGGNLMDI